MADWKLIWCIKYKTWTRVRRQKVETLNIYVQMMVLGLGRRSDMYVGLMVKERAT